MSSGGRSRLGYLVVAAVTLAPLLVACGTTSPLKQSLPHAGGGGPRATSPAPSEPTTQRATSTSSTTSAPATTVGPATTPAPSTTTSVLPAPASPPTTARAPLLVTVGSPGFTVRLPSTWEAQTGVDIGDVGTSLWVDVDDAQYRLEVDRSGCVSCASSLNQTQPEPQLMLPQGVIHTYRISACQIAFTANYSGAPFMPAGLPSETLPDNGLVVVWVYGSHPDGYAQINLWLPPGDPLATTILNSFRPAGGNVTC